MSKLLPLVLVLAALVPQQAGDPRKLVGKTARVCGQVVTYQHVEQDKARCIVRLDLGEPYWSPEFYALLADTARSAMGGAPESDLHGQEICVAGHVERDRKRVPHIVVKLPMQVEQTSTPPAAIFAPGISRVCDEGVTEPKLVREISPVYDSGEYIRRKLEDTLLLEAVVEADGSIGEIRTLYRRHPQFEPAAHRALKQWRFSPATKDGKPVAVVITVEFKFTLKG